MICSSSTYVAPSPSTARPIPDRQLPSARRHHAPVPSVWWPAATAKPRGLRQGWSKYWQRDRAVCIRYVHFTITLSSMSCATAVEGRSFSGREKSAEDCRTLSDVYGVHTQKAKILQIDHARHGLSSAAVAEPYRFAAESAQFPWRELESPTANCGLATGLFNLLNAADETPRHKPTFS